MRSIAVHKGQEQPNDWCEVMRPSSCNCHLFTALHCMQRGLSYERLSVRLSLCLSVRPSVKRVNCDKTKAPSEKSSIMTNRKSPTSFPMSLRCTAYVAPNQRGLKDDNFFVFRTENWTFLEESLQQSFFV